MTVAATSLPSGPTACFRCRAEPGPAGFSECRPPILLVAFDGVDRALLYDLPRKGELPHLAELLGGHDGAAPGAMP